MSTRTGKEVYNQKLIIGITTALLVLCYMFYFLRILSRKLLRTPLWIDDWFMLFVLGVCSVMSTCNYVGVRYGSGIHRYHLEASEYRSFQINLYVYMMSWALAVAVVKIGILLFYWRIFVVREFRRLVAIVGAIVLASSVAIFLSFMFQCHPIPRFWADTTDGYCINQILFYVFGGSVNIVSDVVVLSLPLRQVWKLNASVKERAALTFLFCLGSFVCITSILRLIAVHQIDPADFSYTNVGGGLWSTVEAQVGFICANLPHTRPLAIRWLQRWSQHRPSTNDYRNSFNSHSRSHHDTAGFVTLGSKSKSTATAAGPVSKVDVERGDSRREEVGSGEYGSDHELTLLGAPRESGAARVEVQTEIRQEVQRIESPRGSDWEQRWGGDVVSTKITA